jgi:dCMP deaminase
MNSWDKKFINLCDHIATWSKDDSTKVGAVIVNKRNKILSIGYNGLPIGVSDNKTTYPERHQRPEKYKWYCHAEENAIASAAELGVSLQNTKIYCNYLPCPNCSRLIIQSGIKEIMFKNEKVNSESEPNKISLEMLRQAKVRVRKFETA